MKKLTILIPTYNRKNYLKRTLQKLIPQLTDECQILILDNASDYDIKEELKELTENQSIKIKINKANIGFGGNICRGFLEVDTEWFWLVGDDDIPSERALSIILDEIEKKGKEVIAFKYSYSYLDKNLVYEEEVINSVNELLDKFENKNSNINFSNFLYMSTFVFKSEEIKKELKIGYETIGTYANHVIMLLLAMKKTKKSLLFSSKIIIENNILSYDEKWSRLKVGLGITSIFNLNLDLDKKRRQYLINALSRFLNIKELFIETFNKLYFESDKRAEQEYKEIYRILISQSNIKIIKIFYILTRITLLNKRLGYYVCSIILDLKRGSKISEERL